MAENETSRLKSIVHARNVGPEIRACFNHRMSVDELATAMKTGHAGPMLLKLTDNPDENVVVEYVTDKTDEAAGE